MRKFLTAVLMAAFAAMTPAKADEAAEVLTVNGRGGLTLSSSATTAFQDYLQHKCPLIMAAHESGGWVTAFTGPEENCNTGAVDYRRFIRATLANCEGGWRYGECWIVAIGPDVVWDGTIRFRKGRWTPKGKRQFAVTLSGEGPRATSGLSTWSTVGLATWRRDGKAADLTFKTHPVLGRCKGELTVAAGQPSPYTVTCSKLGQLTGRFDFNADGATGAGAGSGKEARHVDLRVLPRTDQTSTAHVARQGASAPRS